MAANIRRVNLACALLCHMASVYASSIVLPLTTVAPSGVGSARMPLSGPAGTGYVGWETIQLSVALGSNGKLIGHAHCSFPLFHWDVSYFNY